MVKILNDVTIVLKKSKMSEEYTVHIDRCKKVTVHEYDNSWIHDKTNKCPREQIDDTKDDSESVTSDNSLSDPEEQ